MIKAFQTTCYFNEKISWPTLICFFSRAPLFCTLFLLISFFQIHNSWNVFYFDILILSPLSAKIDSIYISKTYASQRRNSIFVVLRWCHVLLKKNIFFLWTCFWNAPCWKSATVALCRREGNLKTSICFLVNFQFYLRFGLGDIKKRRPRPERQGEGVFIQIWMTTSVWCVKVSVILQGRKI